MDGHAEALEFIVGEDAKIINIPLKDLRIRQNILIGGITRERKRIVPGGNDVILPGDHVIIIAANQRVQNLADILEK